MTITQRRPKCKRHQSASGWHLHTTSVPEGASESSSGAKSPSRTMIRVTRSPWAVPCLLILISPLRVLSASGWTRLSGPPGFLDHPKWMPDQLRLRLLCDAEHCALPSRQPPYGDSPIDVQTHPHRPLMTRRSLRYVSDSSDDSTVASQGTDQHFLLAATPCRSQPKPHANSSPADAIARHRRACAGMPG